MLSDETIKLMEGLQIILKLQSIFALFKAHFKYAY